MKNLLAFSTLGCPEWDLGQILNAASEYGYDAVELRGYLDKLDLTQAKPFTSINREATRLRFAEAGVAVCCVSSSGVVADANIDHVRAHAELARALDAPFVRVFGGNLPVDMPRAEALARFAENLRAFGDAAQSEGVAIVLETHDAFSTGTAVAELLALTAHPSVFSLWDLHHPYRQGEGITVTHELLSATVRHLHIKDSKDGTYTAYGEGDIPLVAMLDLLQRSGYSGAISLEWEKRWIPTLPPPEVIFPQYAKALRELAGTWS